MNLDELAYKANLFKNDLQHMHWHAAGDDFDKVHAVTQELYEEMAAEVDDIVEMAIASGCQVSNMNKTAEHVDGENDYAPLDGEAYDMSAFIDALAEKGAEYQEALNSVEVENSGYQSKIDEFIAFWNKEVLYKNSARQIGGDCDCEKCEADYRDLLDPENEMYEGTNEEAEADKSLDDTVTDMYSYNDAYANNYMNTDMLYSQGEEVESPTFDDEAEDEDMTTDFQGESEDEPEKEEEM